MTEQELLDLKAEIEESKENLSKMEGRKEALMEQLQKQFGVKTIVEAEKKIKKMEAEADEWDEKIATATTDLENTLNEKQDTADTKPTRTSKRSQSSDSKEPGGPTRRTPRQ